MKNIIIALSVVFSVTAHADSVSDAAKAYSDAQDKASKAWGTSGALAAQNAADKARVSLSEAMNTKAMSQNVVSKSPPTTTTPTTTTTINVKDPVTGKQKAVAFNSYFTSERKGGGNSHSKGGHSIGGSGNGGSNAQNSRSAGGLADSHVGGGRQGGGFHY